jgi:hypothetical protein
MTDRKGEPVRIAQAKGRPMLSWVGKRPLREVRSFSPSILERLSGEEGILAPSIDDWRAMVDSVAIDTAYDGPIFDVELIDIPERRSDLVDGSYQLPIPLENADRPAVVRITDMLGEEILVVEDRT